LIILPLDDVVAAVVGVAVAAATDVAAALVATAVAATVL